ncbi:MAG TPA: hypothetical protein VFK38_01750 [Candidatus Limnocylindrales bacterium]|nr:hypothetical protein [Candidatus Limnocylindrales bacterium]
MDPLLLVLRLAHIGAGIFWVGSFFVVFGFVRPTATALGPAGGPFMGYLVNKKMLPLAITIAATITVIAGASLYWMDSGGLQLSWITSPSGIGFSIGAAAALVSYVLGFVELRPAFDKLGAIGQRLESEHRPPTPEEAAEMAHLNAGIDRAAKIDYVLLTVVVIFMATSRYLR